ncbi:MAG: sulfatase [Alphaproteobacteria bacterium]|nr:MAG: sulfatase [Alphaproteobacteria bacterium]
MWAIAVKFLLIVAYLACDHAAVVERLGALGLSPALAIYIVLYSGLALALFLTACVPNPWVRTALALVLAVGSTFQHSVEWTTHGALTYDAFVDLWNSRTQTSEALTQFGAVLLKALPVGLLLFLGLALPLRANRVPPKLSLGAPLAAITLLSGMFYLRGGEGSRALPAAFPPVTFAGIMVIDTLLEDNGPRQPVTFARTAAPVGRDVVLLIDESVVGNYLDINDPHGVPTGLLQPPPGVRVTNYGYAASVHTCSANSNLGLRYGGTRETYQDTIAHGPSVWAYARRAGMRTVYIDAQSTGGQLQNLMTAQERAEIDDLIQFDGIPVRERDMKIAEVLADRINDGRHEFIYVNKIGAHFPIQDKYPDAMLRYQPVLPRDEGHGLSWSSDRTGFDGRPEEWIRYRNSYRNTLLWNVGEFFHRLLARVDLDRATIIYTSDHGQDLHERGNPGNNTHCGTKEPLQEEGLVPLVVFEGAKSRTLDWGRDLAANRNGMSHFRVFPTVLTLMGYDRAAMKPAYGAALDDPAKDDFSFNLTFNTRLGSKPKWRHIERNAIIAPPESDYAASRFAGKSRLESP